MEEKFTWKAEIKFVGTVDEFNKFAETIEKIPIEINIPEWRWRPHHFAGCMPIPIESMLGKDRLKKLAEGMPKLKIKFIKDIYGGMRTAHFHLGDQIVLLDREKFREFAAGVAHELAGKRVERVEDYIDVMQPIGHIIEPNPQPS
jgi:hypothetical protein